MKYVLMALAVALSYLMFRRSRATPDARDEAPETDTGFSEAERDAVPDLPRVQPVRPVAAARSAHAATPLSDDSERDAAVMTRILAALKDAPQCATSFDWESAHAVGAAPVIRTAYDRASGRIALEMDVATFARHAGHQVRAVSRDDATELLIGDEVFAVLGRAEWNPAMVTARVV